MNEREEFWKGDFGNEYNARSPGDEEANYRLFKRALMGFDVRSIVELGCGVGKNLAALQRLRPLAELHGVEINEEAARAAREYATVDNASILEWTPERTWDIAFTKGVLIHIAPDDLPAAYAKLFAASHRYTLVAEYYSPKPVEIEYRGHAGRLWKRDFAGEMLDAFPLRLIDYDFVYHRDRHPQDDLTWFLLEKK